MQAAGDAASAAEEEDDAPEIIPVSGGEFADASGLKVLADLEGQDDDDEEAEAEAEADDDAGASDQHAFMDVDDKTGAEGDGETFAPERDDAVVVLGDAHTGPVFSVDMHPSANGALVATGGGDDVAVLWQVPHRGTDGTPARGNAAARITAHTDSIAMVRYNTAGTLVATAGLDGKLGVFTIEGENVSTCEGPGGGCEWVAWHPRGDVLLCGCEDFTAWMFNARDGLCMNVFSGHSAAVGCGKFTRDGKRVLTGSSDASVRLWDPRSAACLTTLQGGASSAGAFHEGDVLCCDDALPAEAPSDGTEATRLCISGGAEGNVYLSDIGRGHSFGAMSGGHDEGYSVEAVAFPPSAAGAATAAPPRFAASAGTDGKLVIWDVERNAEWTQKRHPHAVTCVCWARDDVLVTGGADAVVRVWDLRSELPVRELKGHTKAVLDVRVSSDGLLLATASDDHAARLFALA